jgi:hypothetical protein
MVQRGGAFAKVQIKTQKHKTHIHKTLALIKNNGKNYLF